MSLLLSSYFIYNSVGTIDEKVINNLSFVINLSKHLNKVKENEFEDLLDSFPQLMWVLRDFSLRLEDKEGSPITPK